VAAALSAGSTLRTQVALPSRLGPHNVVVAMSNHQQPRTPPFAAELDPRVVQLHSLKYRSPAQLQPGSVLVVGAGNSGAEIAREASLNGHRTWLAGRDTGHIPFDIEGLVARLVATRLVLAGSIGHRVSVRLLCGQSEDSVA